LGHQEAELPIGLRTGDARAATAIHEAVASSGLACTRIERVSPRR
jgi:hypothetical protein